MSAASGGRGGAEAGVDIRFTGGNPSPEEVAAATAVITAALEQAVAEQRTREDGSPSAWSRSQRGLRHPLEPGWRSFSG
ncbi:MAG: acyl-CoA carboxylase subunit epsilon [Actinomycetales bacterium]|nr:acyl-CoA carboxylase subunit epsilon [Actinomycetales bacterium]